MGFTTLSLHHLFLLLLATVLHQFTSSAAIGVNYGMVADNLPPPSEVANFIKTKTIFDSVKIFDCNPDVLRAFADSGISVTVTVPNGEIASLANVRAARRWVNANIKPFYPQTKIKYISVGNEVLFFNNPEEVNNLVPAIRALNRALNKAGIHDVKVTTAHALNIFEVITLPSLTRFRNDFAKPVFAPLLLFLRKTKSPFMINPYPYFELNTLGNNLDFALFKGGPGMFDKHSGKTYTNAFDVLLDRTFSAMSALGCGDVDIVIGETGWPSMADEGNVATVENALSYNGNLVKEILEGKGTPLMPNRKFEAYIFGLFNENKKPGTLTERNWGLFRPDYSPVYNAGVLRDGQGAPFVPAQPQQQPQQQPSGKKFCVAKPGANDGELQAALDWACSQGTDCGPIQPGAPCAEPATVRSRATFAMNSYYRNHGEVDSACDFSGSAQITTVDPSYGNCHYL